MDDELEIEYHERFMVLGITSGHSSGKSNRRMKRFTQQLGTGGDSQDLGDGSEGTIARDHPMFLKLRRSYRGGKPYCIHAAQSRKRLEYGYSNEVLYLPKVPNDVNPKFVSNTALNKCCYSDKPPRPQL